MVLANFFKVRVDVFLFCNSRQISILFLIAIYIRNRFRKLPLRCDLNAHLNKLYNVCYNKFVTSTGRREREVYVKRNDRDRDRLLGYLSRLVS